MTEALRVPTSLGTSDADRIRLLGQDLTADLMGQVRVRRARVLAGGAAAADVGGPGLRGGARRAGRPRLHTDGDRRG